MGEPGKGKRERARSLLEDRARVTAGHTLEVSVESSGLSTHRGLAVILTIRTHSCRCSCLEQKEFPQADL